jgi:predicted RNA binding protein YcfA (HicA-like mRNA interferase family)
MTVYGSSGELNRNVYHFAQLTALGSTESVRVHGSHLTFVHRVTGNATMWMKDRSTIRALVRQSTQKSSQRKRH